MEALKSYQPVFKCQLRNCLKQHITSLKIIFPNFDIIYSYRCDPGSAHQMQSVHQDWAEWKGSNLHLLSLCTQLIYSVSYQRSSRVWF